MANSLCVLCSQPILPTDNTSTIQQVDACTMAVEHVTYHSKCWDQQTAGTSRRAPTHLRDHDDAGTLPRQRGITKAREENLQ